MFFWARGDLERFLENLRVKGLLPPAAAAVRGSDWPTRDTRMQEPQFSSDWVAVSAPCAANRRHRNSRFGAMP
jgi:hypothetical protein